MDAKDETFKRKLIEDLSDIGTMTGEFKFTKEYLETYAIWHKTGQRKDFIGTFLESYEARRPIHHLKLSTIINASRTSEMIVDKEDFDKGVEYLGEVEKNMKFTFSGMGANPQAQTLAKIIGVLASREVMQLSELMGQLKFDTTHLELIGMLKSLELAGNLKMTNHTKEGDVTLTYKSEE